MPLQTTTDTRTVSRTTLAIIVFLISVAAFAQSAGDIVTTSIDWSTGTLFVTVERSLEAAGARGPAAVS